MRTDLPDVNVLVALFTPHHEHHDAAHAWLASTQRFATTPLTQSGFVRVMMAGTPATDSVTCAEAIDSLRELSDLPSAAFWPDATSWVDQRMVTSHVIGHRQVPETHLLNLAITHGGCLVTFDKRITPSLGKQARRHVRQLA